MNINSTFTKSENRIKAANFVLDKTLAIERVKCELMESLEDFKPQTSFENIAENIVRDFICYSKDEASNFLFDKITNMNEFLYQCILFFQFLDMENYDLFD